jgi:predicted 3-demethylubiquinone-9 3-methyltransferase (glyoxalase superfamily)
MKAQPKITPNFWFDHSAEEAVDYYTGIFPGSSVNSIERYPASTEEGLADFQFDLAGDVLTIDFTLGGNRFTAINAGPEFSPTPAHSTTVYFDMKHDEEAQRHLDDVWTRLIDGGSALMPLQQYDFSPYFGWVQDKYGYSWQLMLLDDESDERECMVPSLLFGGPVQNRAKEAVDYYMSVFHDTSVGTIMMYDEPNGVVTPDSVRYADFQLEGQWFPPWIPALSRRSHSQKLYPSS